MTQQRWVAPVTLSGARVRLEPLEERHLDELKDVAFDDAIWRWTIAKPIDEPTLRAWFETAQGQCQRRHGDAVRDRRHGERPRDRQHQVHDDHARAPSPRDRLDLGRDGLPAIWGEPGGEAPPADATRSRRSTPSASSSRPMPGTSDRVARSSASARPSKASCATTRSCPTARTATPRSTACSPGSGPASRHASRPCSPVDRDHDDRLPHRWRAIPHRHRRCSGARGPDRAGAPPLGRRECRRRPPAPRQRATRSRRHVRRASSRHPTTPTVTWASCSSTTRAIRRRAGTGRSRW